MSQEQRIVPAEGRCHLYDLLAASQKVGTQLTKDFYVSYADMRQDAFESLCEVNGNESRHAVLTATQKLLDRVLFTAFCEDRGLLPDAVLRRAFEHKDPFNPRPVWENFRGLFRSINAGNDALQIPAYNGGLFADDPVVDRLVVPDNVCAYFRDLGEYQYRSAYEVVADTDEAKDLRVIDVDILGHIFEQSITDLEQLRNELDGLVAPARAKRNTRPGGRRRGRSTRRISSPATSWSKASVWYSPTNSRSSGWPKRAKRPARLPRPWPIPVSMTWRPEQAATGCLDSFLGIVARSADASPFARPGLRQRGLPDRSLRPVARRFEKSNDRLWSCGGTKRFSTWTGRFCKTTCTAWT